MEAPALVKNGAVGDWRLSDVDFLASFHLPGVADKHDRLKDHNPLPRDRRIVFHEEKHEYLCDNVKAPRSVTGLVHTYAWEFDPHAAVRAMKNGARWPKKRASFMTDSGTEMSDGEIVEMWKSSGQIASARGTLLHWHVEMHLNGMTLELPHSPDFAMFLTILDVLQGWGLRPFPTQQSLFVGCGYICAAYACIRHMRRAHMRHICGICKMGCKSLKAGIAILPNRLQHCLTM